VCLHVPSSVTIILANKIVFRDFGFSYATLLTVFHFVFTFIGLHILCTHSRPYLLLSHPPSVMLCSVLT
jgi:hypothetical protein